MLQYGKTQTFYYIFFENEILRGLREYSFALTTMFCPLHEYPFQKHFFCHGDILEGLYLNSDF